MLRSFSRIPISLPVEDIYRRLGRNRHSAVLTPLQLARMEAKMQEAFADCQPQGCYEILAISDNTGGILRTEDEHVVFHSESLVRLLEECRQLVLLATTVGERIVEKTAELIAAGEGADALVYDATASEAADAAMDWLCGCLNRELPRLGGALTRTRFSPGYGDLSLQAQGMIFRRLQLEKLGIRLTDSQIMIPEKSVTALAGVVGCA